MSRRRLLLVAVLTLPGSVGAQTIGDRLSAGQCDGLPGATCGGSRAPIGSARPVPYSPPPPPFLPPLPEPEFKTESCRLTPNRGGSPEHADCLIDRKGHLRLALFPASNKYPGGHAAVFHWQPEKNRPVRSKVIILGLPGNVAKKPRFHTLDAATYKRLLAQVSAHAPRGRTASRRGTVATASTSPAGDGFAYDPNGNLTADPDGTRYEYDQEDRLAKITKTDGTVIEHVYDPDGNLVRKTALRPGQQPDVVDYLVDVSGPLPQVVAETDGVTGALRAAYTRGAHGELLSVMRPNESEGYTTRQVHSDYLGSVRALTDESGAVTDRYEYTASGELISHTGNDPQPYGFAGEARDPDTGLYYNRARWFSPRFGRFLSMDTFQGRQDEPASLHKYLYAGADPVNKTDPTGHDFSLSVSLTSLAASSTINSIGTLNARAMLNTAGSLELVPFRAIERERASGPDVFLPFLGWGPAEMQAQLATTTQTWERYGIRVYPAAERPPVHVDDANIRTRTDAFSLMVSANLTTWSPQQVPVAFVRSLSIGGPQAGATFSSFTPSRHPSYTLLSAERAVPTTLAHELGHSLGLSDTGGDAGFLMFETTGRTGTRLRTGELETARKFFSLRVGGSR